MNRQHSTRNVLINDTQNHLTCLRQYKFSSYKEIRRRIYLYLDRIAKEQEPFLKQRKGETQNYIEKNLMYI